MRITVVCLSTLLLLVSLFNSTHSQCTWKQPDFQWWSNPTSWPSVTTPVNGSDVVITAGYKVVYDISQQTFFFNSITIQSGGALFFDQSKNIYLSTKYIWIQPGGSFKVGSAACPYSFKATIQLNGPRDNVTSIGGFGNKGIINGGTLEFYGTPPQPTWTRIASIVNKGDSTFTVQDNLVNWKAGDTIVLASTDYYQELSEQLTIASVVGNQITVSQPAAFMHWAANNQFAEVGSITRNIVIQGDPSSDISEFGGHVILYGNATGKVWGVEFTRMGQAGQIGRYPFHFHVMGDQMGRGHFVSENSFHHNYQRCFTVHGTSGILARNNVGWNVTGHCYFFEEGSEMLNVYDHNLGIMVRPGKLTPTDATPSIFWITNPNNTIINNAAVGGTFGIWYAFPKRPIGLTSYLTNIRPRGTQFGIFQNNIVHSCSRTGIQIDSGPKPDGTPEESDYIATVDPLATTLVYVRTYISNNIAYKNRVYGIWIRGSYITVSNVLLMDNGIGINVLAGSNLVKDSVIIGETPNIGTTMFTPSFNDLGRSRPKLYDIVFPIHGVEFYDTTGNQYARNVTFINFTTDSVRYAGAVGVVQYGILILPPNVITAQVKLINSNPWAMVPDPYHYDGPSHVVVHDADGTLTGTYGGHIVSNNSILTYTNPNCQKHPEWRDFMLCDKNEESYIHISLENGNTTASDFTSYTYNDNGTIASSSTLTNWYRASFIPFGRPEIVDQVTGYDFYQAVRYQYSTTVPSRHGYVANFAHPTPSFLKFYLRFAATGDWVVLAFSYPRGTNFTLQRSYSMTPLTMGASFNDLSPTTYYYDPVSQYLYVMYFEDDGVLTSADGFPANTWGGSYVFIKASCGSNCSVAGARLIPATLPDNEDMYKAVMRGCAAGASNNLEGTAILRYNPKTRRLSYLVYHNVPDATSATFQDTSGFIYDMQVAQSPIKGAFLISLNRWNALWNGNWSITIASANPLNTITGCFGCSGTCSTPPLKSATDLCATIPGELRTYNDSLVKDNIWVDFSWTSTRVYNYTLDKACGKNSMAVTYNSWGSLSLHPNLGFSSTPYAFLQFNVKCPSGALPFPLTIGGATANNTYIGQLKVDTKYIDNAVIENSWTRVKIPLVDLKIMGWEAIGTINFLYNANTPPEGVLVLFDDIKFVPAYTDPYTVPPAGSPKIFNGLTCQPCGSSSTTVAPTTAATSAPTTTTTPLPTTTTTTAAPTTAAPTTAAPTTAAPTTAAPTTAAPTTNSTCGAMQACGQNCYNPNLYTCYNGFLCPANTRYCTNACYSPSNYNCVDGRLVLV